jgi:hypothetical protein
VSRHWDVLWTLDTGLRQKGTLPVVLSIVEGPRPFE